jgi:hypothetical protein
MIECGILRKIFPDVNEDKLHEITKSNLPLDGRLYLLTDHSILLETLKLTKNSKARIMEYKKFEKETPLYILYKKGSEFLAEIQEIKRIKFGIDPIISGMPSGDFPKFPVTFADLPPGIREARKKLNDCERWWVNSGCLKTRSECVAYILYEKHVGH